MIKRYSNKELDILADILINDGVISVPTDTVYGVCARINSKDAYDKLVMVKNRPSNKAFPLMCLDINQVKEIAYVDERIEKIINNFMPGPLTVILKKKDNLDGYVTNGNDTVAIRLATSKELEELIRLVGCPLFMTSANQSGEEPCINIDDIEKCCPLVDAILEGDIKYNKSSTILDCTKDELLILREGPISLNEINNMLK